MKTVLWMQRVFSLIVAAHVLAYVTFVTAILVIIGGRKVYVLDVVFALLGVGLLVALSTGKLSDIWSRQKSTVAFGLFAVWGLIELARGIPRFGLSAVGEARYFFLPALFLFFVPAAYRDRIALKRFVTFAVMLVCVLPVLQGLVFYMGGGRSALVDYFTNASLGAQAGFRFIQAGEAALVSCAAVGLLIFTTAATPGRQRYTRWLLSTFLLVVLAVAQVRSAWVMTAVGLALGSLLVARFFKYAIVGVVAAAAVLAVSEPVGAWWRTRYGSQLEDIQRSERRRAGSAGLRGNASNREPPPGGSLQSSLEYSTTFLRDVDADVTAVWRLTLWRQALASAREHPVIGQGLGGYWKNVDPNGAPANQTPHNGYLAVLVKLGGVGIALLLTGLILWCVELMRFIPHEQERDSRLLANALVICVIMMATFAGFYDFTIGFWILLGAGSVLVRSASPGAGIAAHVP